MKLKNIKLRNFQGIASLDMSFNGCSASIYGDNATGKTTVANAANWILFGKPSNGAKGYTPKTRTSDGEAHNLEHSAEATFIIDGGAEITLCRTFREVYKRKRGRMDAEFSGHETVYTIDGVPASEREYAERVKALCGDNAEMISMPDYFAASLDWRERREILLDVCGGVTDKDVFRSDTELAELQPMLGGHSVEDAMKIAKARLKTINSDKPGIPGKISELTAQIPNLSETAISDLLKQKKAVEAEIAELEREIESINAEAADLRKSNRQKCEDAKSLAAAAEKSEKEAYAAVSNAAAKYGNAKYQYDFIRGRLASYEQAVRNARVSLASVENEHIPQNVSICPTCGKPLDGVQKDDAIRKWNSRHDAEVKAAQELYDAAVASLNAQDKAISDAKQKMLDAAAEHGVAKERYDALHAEAERLKKIYQEWWENVAADDGFISVKTHIQREALNMKRNELSELTAHIARNEANSRTASIIAKRIEELKTEERAMGAEGERLYRLIMLGEAFIRRKVSMLTENINSKFRSVRFQLFAEQINGGLKECCEVLIPSPDGSMVPWQLANNGARINAGLEIIGVLAKHFGCSIPVWVDNAEAVTNLVAPEGLQTIRLCVSEEDKELRMEVE